VATRPRYERDVDEIGAAVVELRRTRDRLREAGARRAARYVQRAIKSAEGAQHHAALRDERARREDRHGADAS
jgi:hypothetical protein